MVAAIGGGFVFVRYIMSKVIGEMDKDILAPLPIVYSKDQILEILKPAGYHFDDVIFTEGKALFFVKNVTAYETRKETSLLELEKTIKNEHKRALGGIKDCRDNLEAADRAYQSANSPNFPIEFYHVTPPEYICEWETKIEDLNHTVAIYDKLISVLKYAGDNYLIFQHDQPETQGTGSVQAPTAKPKKEISLYDAKLKLNKRKANQTPTERAREILEVYSISGKPDYTPGKLVNAKAKEDYNNRPSVLKSKT
jgi:hypothetical protein